MIYRESVLLEGNTVKGKELSKIVDPEKVFSWSAPKDRMPFEQKSHPRIVLNFHPLGHSLAGMQRPRKAISLNLVLVTNTTSNTRNLVEMRILILHSRSGSGICVFTFLPEYSDVP